MAKKRSSRPGYKAGYARYATENRLKKNKERRLARHLAKHPNDKQSAERKAPESYQRRRPLSYWEKVVLNSRIKNKVSK